MNPYAAQIYIDGSCLKNPGGPGGCAGLLELPEDTAEPEIIFQEGYKRTTNNRMELMALIKTFEYLKKTSNDLRKMGINQIEIWSDSEITIKGHQSVEKWRSNSWAGSNDNPIKNIDLLKHILTLKRTVGVRYTLKHVQNKSTVNTKNVDRLAKEASKKPSKIDSGYIEPKISRTKISGSAILFPAKKQTLEIRVYEHSPVSRRKDSIYKVKFEVRVDLETVKYYAYCSREIDTLLHRHHYYLVTFNDNPNNPTLEYAEEVER